MRPRQVHALRPRHLIAIAVIVMLTAAMAWSIEASPMVYAESANVIFIGPGTNPYSTLGTELVPAANLITQTMQSPASRQQAQRAGATAGFSFGLVNMYNEQFPFYPDPYVTVTAQSTSPAQANRTFQIVMRRFRALAIAEQARVGVKPGYFIRTYVVGDTGPLARPGSHKRAFAGLALLALLMCLIVIAFLDRHPIQMTWGGIRRAILPRLQGA